MASSEPMVVVGAGLAGAKAAEALRSLGHDGPVVVVGDEEDRPYERPPLSKGYLTGAAERDSVFVHGPDWYREHDVDLRLGRTVTAVERDARHVVLDSGDRVPFARLLLATGSVPRRLAVPGADLPGVAYLRRLSDSDRLRAAFAESPRVTVVGAGWIGLEVAAAARGAGCEVTVLEQAELPLVRVLGPEIAQVFADLHRDHGVDLRLGVEVAEVAGRDGAASGVRLADGEVVPADLVVVGVGAAPVTSLAQDAGLVVDDGVVVDEHLRSSDPDVFAAGDVANAYHPLLRQRLRVEHWANALNQPAVAAAGMLGEHAAYDRLPYFYTDQYDLGMEYTGHAGPGGYDDVVVRGDLAGREFVAMWLREGRLLAAMNVNVWDVVEPLKALITAGAAGAVLDRARLADTEVTLEELVEDATRG